MPRPPTKHGLERKFKPWRKGKSQQAKSKSSDGASENEKHAARSQHGQPASSSCAAGRGSLKNQLRSQRRFLSKLKSTEDDEENVAAAMLAAETRIKDLEDQIAERERVEREKRNAQRYHQVKFFERQKLTRMERTARRKLQELKESSAPRSVIEQHETELNRIVLDQLYVAHFPNDTKYLALFSNGERVRDDSRTSKRREAIRMRIIKKIRDEGGLQGNVKSWVGSVPSDILENFENYDTKPAMQKSAERKDYHLGGSKGLRGCSNVTEGVDISNKHVTDGEMNQIESNKVCDPEGTDTRVPSPAKLQFSERTNVERTTGSDSTSDSDDSSEGDSADPMDGVASKSGQGAVDAGSGASEPSDSSDSSDSETSSSGSSSDSESDSRGSSNEQLGGMNTIANQPDAPTSCVTVSDQEDQFLIAEDEGKESTNAFAKAEKVSSGKEGMKGDKSKGWATQRQRPGQYKKRRLRN